MNDESSDTPSNVIRLPGFGLRSLPADPGAEQEPSDLLPSELGDPSIHDVRGLHDALESASDGALGGALMELTQAESATDNELVEARLDELGSTAPDAPPPPHLVAAVIESLLLSSERPLTVQEIATALFHPGIAAVEVALDDLLTFYNDRFAGVRLSEVAKGWQLRTDARAARWVAAWHGTKPMRLSKAALECLSIIAYRQPVTRGEIEDLRGVDSGGVLRFLGEKNLVQTSGRKDEPGRPLMYCTTTVFLELFGLRDLSELPTLRDLRELQRDDAREGSYTEVDGAGPLGVTLRDPLHGEPDLVAHMHPVGGPTLVESSASASAEQANLEPLALGEGPGAPGPEDAQSASSGVAEPGAAPVESGAVSVDSGAAQAALGPAPASVGARPSPEDPVLHEADVVADSAPPAL